ncbi:MAG: menaquinol oxidoreductase [Candidatus Abyssobacteria bacterium SURF_5]|uniref:Menaquinol oxidoreductase n=1 Tax=Abyssobacteria bacterium (strain SURF_5) TaxID=2093360 RepID=A0A3A4NRN4_ABYX5|nr:MAG: menaquinol oxidoreductase [Candidatus Abyssubacteria bacterium SURF_5]
MKIFLPLIAVLALVGIALAGVELANLQVFFGIVIPYAALAVFLGGLVYRVLKWARSPVPFRITLSCGQQKTHPWIKSSTLDNPHSTAGVIGRMALEILFFRSLFRNTRLELRKGPKLSYEWEKWLWLAALAFHYAFLMILLRHLRFFTVPVPFFVNALDQLDGFFQISVPALYLSDIILVAAATYLFLRRIVIPQIKYISLPADYFPLFLILGLATSGILMRYLLRVDVEAIKELTIGLAAFRPVVPAGIGSLFYVHLFLVSVLFAYFPFSKLMHLGGIFLSPTRNLANNNRMRRHINPWNYPVKVHTYDEYEEEFRDKMQAAGLPLEREASGDLKPAGLPLEKE